MSADSSQDPRPPGVADEWHLSLIVGKMDEIKEHLGDKIASVETHVDTRLDSQDRALAEFKNQTNLTLAEIKTQTTRTNGRVTELERVRESFTNYVGVFRWIPRAVGALATTGLTVLILILTGSIKIA